MAGNSSYKSNPFAPTIIRISIGFYFLILGIWGYIDPDLSRQAIHKNSGFSESFSAIYVNLGCYIFFSVGLLLILGMFTRRVSVIGAMLLLPLLYGAGVLNQGENSLAFFLEKRSLLREVVILAGCFSLMLSGGGALTLEGMLKGLSGKPD